MQKEQLQPKLNMTEKSKGNFVIEITRPYFGMLVALGAKDTETDKVQALADLKARLIKEAMILLADIDTGDHTQEMTEQVIAEVWVDRIVPELNYLGYDTGGNMDDEDFEFHDYFMEPSLIFTDEKIESAGNDWASPNATLSIFEEYMKENGEVEETEETEETETEETETEETETEETEEIKDAKEAPQESQETEEVEETEAEEPKSARVRDESKTPPPPPPKKDKSPSPNYGLSDRSNSRLLNWEFFSTVATVDDPKNIPGVIETLSSKGLIISHADMLDAMCFLLVVTETIDLKDANLIFDRFEKLS